MRSGWWRRYTWTDAKRVVCFSFGRQLSVVLSGDIGKAKTPVNHKGQFPVLRIWEGEELEGGVQNRTALALAAARGDREGEGLYPALVRDLADGKPSDEVSLYDHTVGVGLLVVSLGP